MALRIMSAIVPGMQSPPDMEPESNHVTDRQKLQEELLAAAKLCHIRFGGRVELATESDMCILRLCYAFETIFRHGLRSNRLDKLNSALRHVSDLVSGGTSKNGSSPDVAFWPCIREHLTCHEQDRFSGLRKVTSDLGRGRAWLRTALNERSLERHLHAIINADTLSPYYEDWAFLRDLERSCILPNVAAGLGTILFAIRIDNEELDDKSASETAKCRVSRTEPIISTVIAGNSNATHDQRRKKVPTHIISFDNEEEEEEEEEEVEVEKEPEEENNDARIDEGTYTESAIDSASACLNSPFAITANAEPKEFIENATLDVKMVDWLRSDSSGEEKVLTPVTDTANMGGLIPVSPLDQTLDDMLVTLPNYMDDGIEVTEAAIEDADPLVGFIDHVNAENLDVDSLRTRLIAMNEALEQARDEAVTSRSQLSRYQRQHKNHLERHELQIQALNRENELLRQQLRKYVTAVQMLRRDSDSTTVSDDDPSSFDYHDEAQQYQEKLIQVAEMHAELMEFNTRLTIQLTNRDRLVKLFQAELECLRGPLNEDDIPSEPPCLIHIWIPSAFLTGQNSDIHHVYQIHVRIRDNEWNIYRRYTQFYLFYRELRKHDAIITTFEFPPKKTLGNKDAKFVNSRRQKLQQWLRRVVGRLAQCSPAFAASPSRQTLLSLMPFFGDSPNNDDSRKNNTAQDSSSHQYMGL